MADFPSSLKLLNDSLSEEHLPPEVRISQSISHKEARDAWGSAFRRRWTVNVRALGSEAEALKTHYCGQYGPLIAFNFTPPRRPGAAAPSPVLCRYDGGSLVHQWRSKDLWPATVSIIEVL